MVNKPAALYLEDALHARRGQDTYDLHEESGNLRLSARHGSLGAVAMVRASDREALGQSSPFSPTMTAGALLRGLVRARQDSSMISPRSHTLPEQTINNYLQQSGVIPYRAIDQPRHVRQSPSRTDSRATEVLYAQLDSGFIFECCVSQQEMSSYISQELYQQIQPRPELNPARPGSRLRFNGEVYASLGFATFTMSMMSLDDATKQVEVRVTASVVVDLYPDMFLGRAM